MVDVVNCQDVTIMAADDVFLVASLIAAKPTKVAVKADFSEPMEVIGWYVPVPEVLHHPVKDVSACCLEMDLTPFGSERQLHHLLAELSSMPPLQYWLTFISWMKHNAAHLDMVYT